MTPRLTDDFMAWGLDVAAGFEEDMDQTITLIETLLERFFLAAGMITLAIAQTDIPSRWLRYKAHVLHEEWEEVASDSSSLSVPLLLGLLAGAASLPSTTDTNIRDWGVKNGGSLAYHAVQRALCSDGADIRHVAPFSHRDRPARPVGPALELIQAKLLVDWFWCGHNRPAHEKVHVTSHARMAQWDTLFRLADDAKIDMMPQLLHPTVLGASTYLHSDIQAHQGRVTLWFLWAVDKLVALITQRRPMLPWAEDEIPALSLADIIWARRSATEISADHSATEDEQVFWENLNSFVQLGKHIADHELFNTQLRARTCRADVAQPGNQDVPVLQMPGEQSLVDGLIPLLSWITSWKQSHEVRPSSIAKEEIGLVSDMVQCTHFEPLVLTQSARNPVELLSDADLVTTSGHDIPRAAWFGSATCLLRAQGASLEDLNFQADVNKASTPMFWGASVVAARLLKKIQSACVQSTVSMPSFVTAHQKLITSSRFANLPPPPSINTHALVRRIFACKLRHKPDQCFPQTFDTHIHAFFESMSPRTARPASMNAQTFGMSISMSPSAEASAGPALRSGFTPVAMDLGSPLYRSFIDQIPATQGPGGGRRPSRDLLFGLPSLSEADLNTLLDPSFWQMPGPPLAETNLAPMDTNVAPIA